MSGVLAGMSFHDAEVHALHLDRQGPTLVLELNLVAPPTDAGSVRLRFDGVTDLELGGFNEQNVLFDLVATQTLDGQWEVELDPSFGIGARFRCTAVARVS